jgi:hypothetical protein
MRTQTIGRSARWWMVALAVLITGGGEVATLEARFRPRITVESVDSLVVRATFTDVLGCVRTESTLFASREVTHPSGGGTGAFLDIVESDICGGQTLNRSNTLASVVTLNGNLTSAQLDGTIEVQDVAGSARAVAVSLTFTGVGTITSDRNVTRTETNGVVTVITTRGSERNAQVTGRLDGVDVSQVEAQTASIEHNHTNTITITRN